MASRGIAKHTTLFTYDSSGRLETEKNPALTITRHGYDVLGREKTRKVGTVDGGAGDDMTLVEELFYDDEEDTSTNVGDGFLTRRKLHVTYLTGGERTTDYAHDYRGRLIETMEHTKLSGGELVVLSYPHIDSAYYHAAVGITVSDYDGNVVTQAQGELFSAQRNTNLDEDFDEADSTLAVAFEGTIIQRTDHTYTGAKRTKTEVWSDADNGSAAKHTTLFTYDSSGRLETEKNPALTITRHGYDVLGREKTRKVGTVDGGAGDDMTLVEELFYDDEEDTVVAAEILAKK